LQHFQSGAEGVVEGTLRVRGEPLSGGQAALTIAYQAAQSCDRINLCAANLYLEVRGANELRIDGELELCTGSREEHQLESLSSLDIEMVQAAMLANISAAARSDRPSVFEVFDGDRVQLRGTLRAEAGLEGAGYREQAATYFLEAGKEQSAIAAAAQTSGFWKWPGLPAQRNAVAMALAAFLCLFGLIPAMALRSAEGAEIEEDAVNFQDGGLSLSLKLAALGPWHRENALNRAQQVVLHAAPSAKRRHAAIDLFAERGDCLGGARHLEFSSDFEGVLGFLEGCEEAKAFGLLSARALSYLGRFEEAADKFAPFSLEELQEWAPLALETMILAHHWKQAESLLRAILKSESDKPVLTPVARFTPATHCLVDALAMRAGSAVTAATFEREDVTGTCTLLAASQKRSLNRLELLESQKGLTDHRLAAAYLALLDGAEMGESLAVKLDWPFVPQPGTLGVLRSEPSGLPLLGLARQVAELETTSPSRTHIVASLAAARGELWVGRLSAARELLEHAKKLEAMRQRQSSEGQVGGVVGGVLGPTIEDEIIATEYALAQLTATARRPQTVLERLPEGAFRSDLEDFARADKLPEELLNVIATEPVPFWNALYEGYWYGPPEWLFPLSLPASKHPQLLWNFLTYGPNPTAFLPGMISLHVARARFGISLTRLGLVSEAIGSTPTHFEKAQKLFDAYTDPEVSILLHAAQISLARFR
jgi:hypothetical protein